MVHLDRIQYCFFLALNIFVSKTILYWFHPYYLTNVILNETEIHGGHSSYNNIILYTQHSYTYLWVGRCLWGVYKRSYRISPVLVSCNSRPLRETIPVAYYMLHPYLHIFLEIRYIGIIFYSYYIQCMCNISPSMDLLRHVETKSYQGSGIRIDKSVFKCLYNRFFLQLSNFYG